MTSPLGWAYFYHIGAIGVQYLCFLIFLWITS